MSDLEDMARAGTLRQLNELRAALLDWFDARDRWGNDSNEAYELEHVTREALTGESEIDRLRIELAWACDTIERLVGESLTKLNARGRDHLERASELAVRNKLTPYEQSVLDRAFDRIEDAL